MPDIDAAQENMQPQLLMSVLTYFPCIDHFLMRRLTPLATLAK
jgi:hypothetical protein